ARFHANRIAGRHRHHRHPGRDAAAGALAGQSKGKRIACLGNLRQVGFAVHMYDLDFNGKLPNPHDNQTYDFNNQHAPDNPLKSYRPYISAKNPTDTTPVYICQTALPSKKLGYAPTAISSTAILFSQLIIDKGLGKLHNPARTVV